MNVENIMNVSELVEEMDDEKLATCVKEVLNWHDSGTLCYGLIRILAEKVEEIIKTSEYKYQLAEKIVLTEAAKRFVNINEFVWDEMKILKE